MDHDETMDHDDLARAECSCPLSCQGPRSSVLGPRSSLTFLSPKEMLPSSSRFILNMPQTPVPLTSSEPPTAKTIESNAVSGVDQEYSWREVGWSKSWREVGLAVVAAVAVVAVVAAAVATEVVTDGGGGGGAAEAADGGGRLHQRRWNRRVAAGGVAAVRGRGGGRVVTD